MTRTARLVVTDVEDRRLVEERVRDVAEVVPEAGCPEEHFTTRAAAQVMWAWLKGGLPAGCGTADPVD